MLTNGQKMTNQKRKRAHFRAPKTGLGVAYSQGATLARTITNTSRARKKEGDPSYAHTILGHGCVRASKNAYTR